MNIWNLLILDTAEGISNNKPSTDLTLVILNCHLKGRIIILSSAELILKTPFAVEYHCPNLGLSAYKACPLQECLKISGFVHGCSFGCLAFWEQSKPGFCLFKAECNKHHFMSSDFLLPAQTCLGLADGAQHQDCFLLPKLRCYGVNYRLFPLMLQNTCQFTQLILLPSNQQEGGGQRWRSRMPAADVAKVALGIPRNTMVCTGSDITLHTMLWGMFVSCHCSEWWWTTGLGSGNVLVSLGELDPCS